MTRLSVVLIIIALLVSACTLAPEKVARKERGGAYYLDDGPPSEEASGAKDIPDAIPREEPRSRIGNSPYTVFGKRYYPIHSALGYREVGEASWYGKKFHGRKTSSGETYDMYKMTAAHKTLPLPTYVQVRRIDTGDTVVVRVNDRGPFLKGRIIDLSYVAARKIGLVQLGKAAVEVTAIKTIDQKSDLEQTGLFLEAARFRLPENAENLRERLLKSDIAAVNIIAEDVGKIVYYRVRVGPINDDQKVDLYVSRIQSVTGLSPKRVFK